MGLQPSAVMRALSSSLRGMPAQQQVRMPRALERAQDRRAGEPGVAGEVDAGAVLAGDARDQRPAEGGAAASVC